MANAQDGKDTHNEDHVITVSCVTEYPAYEAGENAKCWGLVTLKASHEPEESKRPALDIVAVIDKSGSMRGEKLFLVKKSLALFVQNLLEKDRLCVVTYDTRVFVNFELLPMTSENKDFAKQKIQGIVEGSSTNLCAGLLQGLREILDRQKDKMNDVASVLLFTDGLANEGITEKSMIIKAMKNPKKYLKQDLKVVDQALAFEIYQNNVTQDFEYCNLVPQQQVQSSGTTSRAKPVVMQSNTLKEDNDMELCMEAEPSEEMEEEKVAVDINASVYTFGFGTDHDPDLLKAISDAADGMYFYIENDEQILESFGHCLGGLVSTLGQNIKIDLELSAGVSVDTIHTVHNVTSDVGLRNWHINLGDIQSQEQRDILLTLNLHPTPSSTNPIPILKTSVTYFCVVDSTYKDSQAEMVVQRSDNVHYSPDTAKLSVDRQRNRILTTKAVKEALQMASQGKLDLAKQRLTEEIKRVRESLTGKDAFCEFLVKDLERSLLGLRNRHTYESSGMKSQLNFLQMHSKQRSNRTTANPYTNSTTELYQAKFK